MLLLRFWLHRLTPHFIQLKDISVFTMTPCCPVYEAVSLYQRGNRVIGFCGLLCGRSHVIMSWVLNVSITGHDKLSWHPRSQLYKPVIVGYTAQLIHFKTLVWKSVAQLLTAPVPGGEQWTQFPTLWYITSNATIKRLFESQFAGMHLHVGLVWGGHKPYFKVIKRHLS